MPHIDFLVVGSIVLMLYAIFQLAIVGACDFRTQKIRNRDVGYLLLTGLGLRAIDWIEHSDRFGLDLSGRFNFEASIIASLALFAATFVLWLLKKVGAGDVKLLSVIPLIVGFQYSLVFAVLLMVCTLIVVFLMKQPMVLPERMFREYVASLGRFNRVPFGIPTAAATIATLVYVIVATLVKT